MATHFPAGAVIVDSVTKTVGAAGDFATIQAAVDWFKGKLVMGPSIIQELDGASYDEAVVFENIYCTSEGSLILRGDTRALAGITYADGCRSNPSGIANGGTFSTGNECTLATNGARDEITVSGGTVDPDFNADGWGNGDRILVYADDGVSYERIISSISPGGAGNNVIGITVALPAGATLGNDATAVALVPDRAIERTAAGPCIYVCCTGVKVDGWYLQPSTGAQCNSMQADGNGTTTIAENVLAQAEDIGFRAIGSAFLDCQGAANSAWDCADGFSVRGYGRVNASSCVANNCARGFDGRQLGYMYTNFSHAVNCTTGFGAQYMGHAYSTNCTARQCTTGYYATDNSYLRAVNANAQNNGNGADYNPAVSGVPGNNDAVIVWS